MDEGDDVFDIGFNEAFEGVVGRAAKIEAIVDFGATGGVPLFCGFTVRKAFEDSRVWRFGFKDRDDDLTSGNGADKSESP